MASRPPDIARLSQNYRRLILWFGVQLLLGITSVALSVAYRQVEPPFFVELVSLAVSAGILGTLIALVIYSYRTADALGTSVPALWAIAMAVPWINAFSLVALSSRSTAACRGAGVPVGLLGPKLAPQSALPVPVERAP